MRSSAGDSSPPRVRTWTSTPSSTNASESFRTWRASPPSISGGYSQERMRTRVTAAGSGERLRSGARARIRGSVAGVGVYGLKHRLGVRDRPLVGVIARLTALVEKRPVAGLGREQLASPTRGCGLIASPAPRPRNRRSSSRRAPQARSATGGESQVLRSLPSPQLEAASGRWIGSCSARACGAVSSRTPAALGAAEHRPQPNRPLRPPVSDQLGVDRKDDEAAAPAACGVIAEAGRDRRRKIPPPVKRPRARLRGGHMPLPRPARSAPRAATFPANWAWAGSEG